MQGIATVDLGEIIIKTYSTSHFVEAHPMGQTLMQRQMWASALNRARDFHLRPMIQIRAPENFAAVSLAIEVYARDNSRNIG